MLAGATLAGLTVVVWVAGMVLPATRPIPEDMARAPLWSRGAFSVADEIASRPGPPERDQSPAGGSPRR